jgi:hypothetical protein
MDTYPAAEDPDAPEPRTVHIRSTAFGQGWPMDAPALCGIRPKQVWYLSGHSVTCSMCRAERRSARFRTNGLHEEPKLWVGDAASSAERAQN